MSHESAAHEPIGSEFSTKKLFRNVVGQLIADEVVELFECPLGTPQTDWPSWATPDESLTGLPTNGTVAYIGQDPIKEPTQWAVDLEYVAGEAEFHVPNEVVDLRAWSNREAVKTYVSNEAYKEWLWRGFLPRIGEQAHIDAVCASLDNVRQQFSIFDPNKKASDEKIHGYLAKGDPDNARYALAQSFLRYEAKDYPEMMLAHALLQGSFGPYLDRLKQAIVTAPFNDASKNIGQQVILGPLKQLTVFTVYAVPLLLSLLGRKEIVRSNPGFSGQRADRMAISWAWQTLFAQRLLIRHLSSGHYMKCPGTTLLNFIRKEQLVEGLYDFVVAHKTIAPIRELTERAAVLAEHTMANQDFYFHYFRGKEAHERSYVRDGRGPFFGETPTSG